MGEELVDDENEAVADTIVPDDEEDETEDEDEDENEAAESTQEMTKRELFDLAEERGLEFSRKWNKARILQALKEAGEMEGKKTEGDEQEAEAEEDEGIVPDDEEFVESEEEEPAETTTPAAVSGSVGDSSGRRSPMAKDVNQRELDKTVHDMQRIHEEECQRRIDLLKTNEALSRDLVKIEVEVYRYESQQVELESRKRELERLRDQLKNETGRLSDSVNTLQPETDHLKTQAEELREAVERLKTLRREFLSGISQINEEKRDLLGA